MQEIRGLTHLHFIIYQLYDYSMFMEGHYRDIIYIKISIYKHID